jgi:hypothetical protein
VVCAWIALTSRRRNILGLVKSFVERNEFGIFIAVLTMMNQAGGSSWQVSRDPMSSNKSVKTESESARKRFWERGTVVKPKFVVMGG